MLVVIQQRLNARLFKHIQPPSNILLSSAVILIRHVRSHFNRTSENVGRYWMESLNRIIQQYQTKSNKFGRCVQTHNTCRVFRHLTIIKFNPFKLCISPFTKFCLLLSKQFPNKILKIDQIFVPLLNFKAIEKAMPFKNDRVKEGMVLVDLMTY